VADRDRLRQELRDLMDQDWELHQPYSEVPELLLALIDRERKTAVEEAFDRHGPWTIRKDEVISNMFPES
jgi:hypothetical protein